MTFPHLNGRAERLAQELDLEPPEAQWIAVTALHAGCFLHSQYCFFSDRPRVYATRLVRRFIDKKVVVEIPVDGLGLLCRVTNKAVYRSVGAQDSRHRRLAGWPYMYRRLLSLDYVLDRPELPWLPTEDEKLACFDALDIERSVLPHRLYRGVTGVARRYFANKHPIAVDSQAKSAVFVYADSDERTPAGLRNWRTEHAPLWSALHRQGFQLSIVHAGRDPKLSTSVERLFARWRKAAADEQQLTELRLELERLKQALIDDDDELLDREFGGFSRALSYAGELEERLNRKVEIAGFEASYDVWLSSRIRPKGKSRNPLGRHGKKQRKKVTLVIVSRRKDGKTQQRES